MHATRTLPPTTPPAAGYSFASALGWFLVTPLSVFALLSIVGAILLAQHQSQFQDRIYTGVSLWGADLSGLDQAQATQVAAGVFPYPNQPAITLVDPATGQEWVKAPADLGVAFDVEATVEQAFQVGRQAGPLGNLREQFDAWYFGRHLSPILVFDEGRLATFLNELSSAIDRPAVDATLSYDGVTASYTPAQVGRTLDAADARSRILSALSDLGQARIELLIHENQPRVRDTAEAAARIQQIIGSPMALYLQEPLDGVDISRVEITPQELAVWLRIELVDNGDGTARHEVFLDENAVRSWLDQFAAIQREPVNARFYFDDYTRQLVVVEPHVSGRALDVEATLQQFMAQVGTANRSLPFVLQEIVPVVNANATAEELGITELVSQSTTWFYGSSANRKHNIARAAARFYGIVIAPGEEFSFNHFLGDVTEEEGFETGLIIVGGRTVEGVGGGVCQVSTTVFQAAFWAGFPIVERWAHGYRVPYYDDGEGAGMDATVFSPVVDFRFINNTPHYLLIENYYDENYESLTFKFYSTSLGRQVVKEGPFTENVVPPNPDVWEYNEELVEGEVKQVDWAVEGSDVTVRRIVYNSQGELLLDDTFVSNYIPWQNVYQYGPGVTPP
ncbi:MAG: VanW family protein [Chloroflexota bacterium]